MLVNYGNILALFIVLMYLKAIPIVSNKTSTQSIPTR